MIKESDKADLLNWSRDVSAVAGKTGNFVPSCAVDEEWGSDLARIAGYRALPVKHHKRTFLPFTETLVVFLVLMSLTLVCSAAYLFYSTEPVASQAAEEKAGYQAAPSAAPASTTATSTTTTTSTTSTTTTSTSTTTATSTSTTTTTTSTTTTTIECGGSLEPPCHEGTECDPGLRVGADGICHSVTLVPSVKSGNDDGDGCGSWALPVD